MKKIFSLLFLLVTGLSMNIKAQPPASWSFSAKKVDAKTYEIQLAVTLEGDWHTYSQSTPDGGPVGTQINFAKNPLILLDGKVNEIGKLEEHFEPLFGVVVKQFSSKVVFVQKVKLKAAVKTTLNGSVAFMVCNDVECMPTQKQNFSIVLN